MPIRACAAATDQKLESTDKLSAVVVTTAAHAAISARLACSQSISAPAGACAAIPTIPAIDKTVPISASFQCRTVKR